MRFWVDVPMTDVVKYKFEVGQMYFSDVGWFTRFWKCVKINPKTGYVSFAWVSKYMENGIWNGRWVENKRISRKVDIECGWKKEYEVVRIKNLHYTTSVIRADKVVKWSD